MKNQFFCTLIISFICSCTSIPILYAQSSEADPFITVSGEVPKRVTLQESDLQKMNQVTVHRLDKEGQENSFTGTPLTEILSHCKVTTGSELRGENLSKYVLIKCADGYEVLFSLAELDEEFTNQVIILARLKNGEPLPQGEGPFRVILPNDKIPARCAFQVTELVVHFAGF